MEEAANRDSFYRQIFRLVLIICLKMDKVSAVVKMKSPVVSSDTDHLPQRISFYTERKSNDTEQQLQEKFDYQYGQTTAGCRLEQVCSQPCGRNSDGQGGSAG